MAKILVVDDDPEVRSLTVEVLNRHGHETVEAADGETALRLIRAERPNAVVLDYSMPGLTGLDVLARLKAEGPDTAVIMLTVQTEVPLVVEAMRRGAYDFVTKPYRFEDLTLRVDRAVERDQLVREVESLRAEVGAGSLRGAMGPSPQIEKLVERVALVASSSYSVLIVGETGAGKELVARAIHSHGARRRGRFVALDCGAVPESLIESELFGHERGAFTGADRRKEGHFQLAHGGTLFLDELGNLPVATQGKLLRALQEREVRPLGAKEPIQVDVRIIAATNAPLDDEVRAGRFRADLYYRVNEFGLVLPPLRERREDIPHLARRFLAEASRELKRPAFEIADDAVELLTAYRWPGNARELKNVMRRAALLSDGVVGRQHLDVLTSAGRAGAAPVEVPRAGQRRSLREIIEDMTARAEQEAIRQALEETRGNKTEAARLLRVDYKTLYLKLRRYGMK